MLAVLGYTLSKKYRVNKTVVSNELSLSNNMIYQTDYCNPRLRVRKLADFHIKSSYMTGLSGFQKADYISTDMIKNTLGNNVRYLEFSIFSREQNNDGSFFEFNDQNDGSYTTSNFIPVLNDNYTLEVMTGGETYSAQETFMPVVPILEVYQSTEKFLPEVLEVNFDFLDLNHLI